MRWLMGLAVRLYPKAWRGRYEDEFKALLEETKPSWRASFDVLKGAIEMQLRGVRFGKGVIFLALGGFFVALIPSYFIADQYAAKGILKIQPTRPREGLVPKSVVSSQMQEWVQRVFTNQELRRLIEKYRLYPEKQLKEPMEDLVEEMRENIVLQPAGKDLVLLQFRHRDRFSSKRVTEELVDDLVDLSHATTSKGSLFDLGILKPVRMPDIPVYPNRLFMALEGMCVGVVIGVLRAFRRRAAVGSVVRGSGGEWRVD
jgi:hypothetical protein